MKILVTGGAGFIGSALVRYLVEEKAGEIVNLDCLTYAGNLDNLKAVRDEPGYRFERVDIREIASVRDAFRRHRPDRVIHLAAESHVDRSIDGPRAFIDTNVVGTMNLLEAARELWTSLDDQGRTAFRFLHVSTDEVYGSLGETGAFREDTAYDPSSPYSASKAASDHLVRAWQRTFGLPALVTNCSNNYGPYQFPEKLIPLMILNALDGKPLPVYGNGMNVRDWLYVDDHVRALWHVVRHGEVGQTYNIGGRSERTNIDVVYELCDFLDEQLPDSPYRPHRELITFVADRPGHDLRYAIDDGKLLRELGFSPSVSFTEGLARTVGWYIENRQWCERCLDGTYRRGRLGLNA